MVPLHLFKPCKCQIKFQMWRNERKSNDGYFADQILWITKHGRKADGGLEQVKGTYWLLMLKVMD